MCVSACDELCVGLCVVSFFFFQAEDGIRDAQESRGLGDVYKRQGIVGAAGGGAAERKGNSHGNSSC